MATRLQRVKSLIGHAENSYDLLLNECITYVRDRVVIPYCNKHNLRFYAVNGDYWFIPVGKTVHDAVTPETPITVILDTEVHHGRQVIGSLVVAYIPPGYKEQSRV